MVVSIAAKVTVIARRISPAGAMRASLASGMSWRSARRISPRQPEPDDQVDGSPSEEERQVQVKPVAEMRRHVRACPRIERAQHGQQRDHRRQQQQQRAHARHQLRPDRVPPTSAGQARGSAEAPCSRPANRARRSTPPARRAGMRPAQTAIRSPRQGGRLLPPSRPPAPLGAGSL